MSNLLAQKNESFHFSVFLSSTDVCAYLTRTRILNNNQNIDLVFELECRLTVNIQPEHLIWHPKFRLPHLNLQEVNYQKFEQNCSRFSRRATFPCNVELQQCISQHHCVIFAQNDENEAVMYSLFCLVPHAYLGDPIKFTIKHWPEKVNKSPIHPSIQYLSKAYSAKPCSVNLLCIVSNPSPTAFMFFHIPSLYLSVGTGNKQQTDEHTKKAASPLSSPADMEERPYEDREKAAVCNPRRRPSPEPAAGNLTLDFQSWEL